jgi:hypothetical protein
MTANPWRAKLSPRARAADPPLASASASQTGSIVGAVRSVALD